MGMWVLHLSKLIDKHRKVLFLAHLSSELAEKLFRPKRHPLSASELRKYGRRTAKGGPTQAIVSSPKSQVFHWHPETTSLGQNKQVCNSETYKLS
ncbi:hypothetical protein PRK78_002518 [Emydomyces testavorans]|uniref:Uncharacterized protein n=1 Tax=Emydomyces testavorans TaxID=2070801 RepID=A0AAF0IJR0_9EURO|nr:hypothetical protein PRK78_002518 [Emydomyces testavorans]